MECCDSQPETDMTFDNHCEYVTKCNISTPFSKDRHTYICKYEILADINLAVAMVDRQTAQFNSPPKFPAAVYSNNNIDHSLCLEMTKHFGPAYPQA